MSHFCVLVVGEDVEKQLAPFQENNNEDCPEKFLKFNDTEYEHQKEYETKGATKVIMPDGRMLNKWDEEFRVKGTFGTGSDTHKVPEHLEQKEVPFKKLYTTFEKYMKDWHGYTARDKKTGKYGYWENPNAKWDWYVVGGRWTKWLKLKSSEKYCDSALKKHIDYNGMCKKEEDKAREDWLKFHNEYLPLYKKGEEDEEAKQKADKFLLNNFGFFYDQNIQTATLEEYVQCAGTPAPYAVVWNKKWYSKGEMIWFGISTKEEAQWKGTFKELWNEIPDDELLTVVDCHI